MTQATTTSPSSDIIDVAIIGGGVSGAYTAYRLMKADPNESPVLQEILKRSGKEKLDVRLIEMNDRIGGRLWSIHLPGLPNHPADMGGMYFSNFQRNVHGLCTKELKLETKPNDVYSNIYLQHFRQHHFWTEDYEPPVDPTDSRDDYYPSVVPFFLREEEKGKNPLTLLAEILELVPGLKDKASGIEQALKDDKIDQALTLLNDIIALLRESEFTHTDLNTTEPLYNYGFWNVLVTRLSNEAYNMIKKSSTLHSLYSNWNLYDALLLLASEFYVGPSYHGLTTGYDTLPKTLVKKFEKLGGVVNMKTQLFDLQSAEYNGEALIKLTIGEPTNKSKSDLYARYVVLALPQRALKLLDCESIIFADDDFRNHLIDTVTAYPASKLILAYDQPWWEQISQPARPGKPAEPITTGYSVTDLPLKACYYIGTESTGQSLLVASLADGSNERFWSGLQVNRSAAHQEDDLLTKLNHKTLTPTPKMVREAQRQLKEMHTIDEKHAIDIPDPVAGLFLDWEDDPFGGGWHYWNFGVPSWKVAPRIRHPNPKVNIFLCGEAYSSHQGWVEGALNTAEMVLSEHFALPRPDWVPDNYDFGP